MLVQCLGSGDAFGSGGRMNTCFLVKTTSTGILLDCGASALIGLKKAGFTGADIDAIIITHLHGDHFGGLAFVICEIIAMRYRSKPLTIIGPERTEEKTRVVLECFFPGVEIKPDSGVIFKQYEPAIPLVFDSFQLTSFPAVHAPATNPHSIRLQVGHTVIAYSGDTEWSDALIAASMNADLFICEASTWNKEVNQHLSVKTILAQLHRLQAKRIVLTHLGEEALNHISEIPFTIATDGMILMQK